MSALSTESIDVDNCRTSVSHRTWLSKLGLPVKWFFVGLIWVYRYTLGVFLGGSCRFEPSCSHYAEEALQTHGPTKGLYLTIRRVLRCNPWGPFGPDPVPQNEKKTS